MLNVATLKSEKNQEMSLESCLPCNKLFRTQMPIVEINTIHET